LSKSRIIRGQSANRSVSKVTSDFYKAYLAEKVQGSINAPKPLPVLALTSDKPFMIEENPYMTDMYPTA